MEIQSTYCSFEQAKLLKEKGFDLPCKNYSVKDETICEGFDDPYWGDNRIVNWNKDVVGIKPFYGFVSRPEQWQIVEWAFQKHNCFIQVISFNTDKQMKFKYQLKRYEWDGSVTDDIVYDTPNQAYEKGISHFLTII